MILLATGAQSWSSVSNVIRDNAVYGTIAAFGIADAIVVRAPATPRWTGGLLFDDTVGGAIGARGPRTQDTANAAADVLVAVVVAAPLVDAALTVGWANGASGVAWNLAAIDAEAFVLTNVVTWSRGLLHDASGGFIAKARLNAGLCSSSSSQRLRFG